MKFHLFITEMSFKVAPSVRFPKFFMEDLKRLASMVV